MAQAAYRRENLATEAGAWLLNVWPHLSNEPFRRNFTGSMEMID